MSRAISTGTRRRRRNGAGATMVTAPPTEVVDLLDERLDDADEDESVPGRGTAGSPTRPS